MNDQCKSCTYRAMEYFGRNRGKEICFNSEHEIVLAEYSVQGCDEYMSIKQARKELEEGG